MNQKCPKCSGGIHQMLEWHRKSTKIPIITLLENRYGEYQINLKLTYSGDPTI